MLTAAVNFALGYTGKNKPSSREKNFTLSTPQCSSIVVSKNPNNGDDFGFASDEVPQGDQETKGYSFLVQIGMVWGLTALKHYGNL